MKNFFYLPLIVLLMFFVSCENDSEPSSNSFINQSILKFFTESDSETADATFYIYSQSTFDHVNSQITDRTLTFSSSLKNQNIGNVFFNNVKLQSTSNYSKMYGLNELEQEDLDIDNLFGNNINFRNENCSNSELCNIDFNFDMIHKFVPQQSTGFNLNTINKSNGFTLRWDKTNIAEDEILGILILEAKQNAKPGDTFPTFSKTIPIYASEISISNENLADFSNNANLNILLVKGKNSVFTLANNKKIKIVGIDILSYLAMMQ